MMTSLKKKFRSKQTIEETRRENSESINYEFVPQHVLKQLKKKGGEEKKEEKKAQ